MSESYRDDECAGKGIFDDGHDDDVDPGHRPGEIQELEWQPNAVFHKPAEFKEIEAWLGAA